MEDDADDNAGLTEITMPQPAEPDSWRQDHLEEEEQRAQRRIEDGTSQDRGSEFLSELAIPRISRDSARSSSTADDPVEAADGPESGEEKEGSVQRKSWRLPWATDIYIISHLIFFAILGTLSRLGVEAITQYAQAPVASPVLWANVGGSFIFGFLAEDRRLFKEEWGTHREDWSFRDSTENPRDSQAVSEIHKKHLRVKRTIPLYIGLSTGFCGSFTSFSTFMRDAFLALSGQFGQLSHSGIEEPHNRGYNFEAVVGIIVIQVACSIGALKMGAHAALATENLMPILPFRFFRRLLDPAVVLLGPGCWLGAVLLAIWPPHDNWRGQVLFSLIFAPVGCLFRFYVSKHLNGRLPIFPTGTFTANVFGTAILGMCYDLQHSGRRTVLSCQILQGVIEGYCGCATTVSTWVGELETLERRHAYVYGVASLAAGLGLLVIIIGSLMWTVGLNPVSCQT